jgi:hypothetical protein
MKRIVLNFLLISLICDTHAQNAAGAQNPAQAPSPAHAQNTVVTYEPSIDDFPNPERGFYIPLGTSASHFVPLDSAALRAEFAGPQKHGKATYAIFSTLMMREYTLDTFRARPLTQEFLDNLVHDLTVIQQAGLKAILRFAYTNTAKSGDCPDVYKICPPYGDAPKSIVLGHIAQLAPLLKEHAAIIAVLQEGFIGIWGENYYTDYFGDAGNNGPGHLFDSSWNDRNQVLHAELEALPADRMIQVRTPQIKQKYVYGPHAAVDEKPLSAAQGYSETDMARIGYHNDCFLASVDDYGTYYDNGSSVQPKKEANDVLRRYFAEDSRYLPVGGETCDDAYSPQNDCAPAGHAEEEMARMHYSFLNTMYNNDVNNDWDSLGCIGSIRKRLGYRLVLRQATFPTHVTPGSRFTVALELYNAGYAMPYNPRSAWLILRNKKNGQEIRLPFVKDIRKSLHWSKDLFLPAGTTPGRYELLLALPDSYAEIVRRPEYSIRLANEDCWEAATGYNKLNFDLTVSPR